MTVLSPQTVSPGHAFRPADFISCPDKQTKADISFSFHNDLLSVAARDPPAPFQPSSSWQGFSYSQGAPDPSLPRSGGLWQMAELLPFGASGEALRVRSWTVDE